MCWPGLPACVSHYEGETDTNLAKEINSIGETSLNIKPAS